MIGLNKAGTMIAGAIKAGTTIARAIKAGTMIARAIKAGTMIAGAILAAGLTAGTAFASGSGLPLYGAGDNIVNVTLPDAVSVGRTTLPAGHYTVTEVVPGELQSTFVFRNGNGDTAAIVQATKTVSPADADSSGASQKTEMILTPDEGGKLHLDKMFVQGETTGYRFVDVK